MMTMGATWAEPGGAGHVGALFASGSTFCRGCQEPQQCGSRPGSPLFASYLLSHGTALKVKGRCGSLLCSRHGAWPRRGIPRKKGVPGAVTGVRALGAEQTGTPP